MLCPDLIGRAAEVALLRGRIDAMAGGRGGVVGLVAEAGAGKTRLAAAAAEAAAARGCPVLTGRAVPGPNPVPYRALVEAFLGAFRSAPVPDSPELAGLGAHLGRLVPAWRRDATAEDSPLLLAEAVVRLLRAHGGGRGCVLVVEDLHWPTRRPSPPSTTSATPCPPSPSCAWRARGPRAPPPSSWNAWGAATPRRSSGSHRWPRTTSTGWWRPGAAPRLAPAERADLLIGLAHAALTAGDVASAERDVTAARALLAGAARRGAAGPAAAEPHGAAGPDAAAEPHEAAGPDAATEHDGATGPDAVTFTAARLDAVAAAVALDQVRLDDAVRLGRAALAAAERADRPEVQCEALEVIGRAERGLGGIRAARGWFERAAEVAERNGMTAWHLRARHELAILDWADGGERQMRATRDLAARYGALVTVAVMDLSRADMALMAFDRDACLTAARACAEASRRFGLATEPVAHLWLAGAHALRATTPACPRPPRRPWPTTPVTRGSSATCTAGCW